MPHRRMLGLWMAVLLLVGCQHMGLVTDSTAPIPESSATKPEPHTNKGIQARWALTFARAKTQGATSPLVFLGDSITEGWDGYGKHVWKRDFSKWDPINLGVSGDRTQHVLWRLEHGQLESIHPKVLVLLIGTNNVADNSVSEIADGIHAIVRLIHTERPETHIIVMKIFPRDEQPGTEWRNKLAAVNQLIEKQVHYRNVDFLDINDKLLEPDGTISRDVTKNFLHPGPKGYEIWADALMPRLEQYLD